MRLKHVCSFLVVCSLLSVLQAQNLRVGRSAVEITPSGGVPLSSGYIYVAAQGVHDPLLAKALVLDQGETRVAIVVCDIIGLPRPTVQQARALIRESPGMAVDFIMVGATHSHSSAAVDKVSLGWTDAETREAAENYLSELPGKIATAVRRAVDNLQPAKISAAIGREDSLTFNRRVVMKDGTIGWNRTKQDPEVVRPAGPIDPDLSVLYFESVEDEPLATVVNFAEHVAVVATKADRCFSADHPHYLSRALEEVKGQDMLTMFVTGASGNLNHLNPNDAQQLKRLAEAMRIGTILAADVLELYPQMESLSGGPLESRSEIVRFPVEKPPAHLIEEARTVWKRAADSTEPRPQTLEIAAAHRILWQAERKGEPLEAEVQVIALGRELAWVGLPGEIFTELGLAIKLASPFPYTIIAGLTNDYLSYVPDRKAYDQGNYEVEVTLFPAGAGEEFVETAVRLLLELYRESLE